MATGSVASNPPPANFQGNLTGIQAPSADALAILRQADCSLTLFTFTYALKMPPTISIPSPTANYEQVLHTMVWKQNCRPGEMRTCITLNGAHGDYLEGITFNDVHITYSGGGTAEEAERRDVPQMVGEYIELGTLPAYGLWARNVRGLEMSNVRFEVAAPDLRPAVVLDHVEDAAVSLLSAQGNARLNAFCG